MNEPDRQDLSSLNPRLEADRWERMVANILERTVFELRRRQAAGREINIFDGLMAWARPALATAAALALISLVALSQLQRPAAAEEGAFIWLASLPAPVEAWLQGEQPPTMLDMLVLTGER